LRNEIIVGEGKGVEKYALCNTIIEISRAEKFSVVFWKVRCVRTVVEGTAVPYAWRKTMSFA
jgi:hypothetical protein